MPLASEVDTRVLFVPVSTRVTVAPGTAASWESVTVPRSEARNCACAVEHKKVKVVQIKRNRMPNAMRTMSYLREAYSRGAKDFETSERWCTNRAEHLLYAGRLAISVQN